LQAPGEVRDSEPRGQTLGWVEGDVLLLVAHTVRTDEEGRRSDAYHFGTPCADPKKRKRYEQETR
jgi:uncharacterized DUF497 family protein